MTAQPMANPVISIQRRDAEMVMELLDKALQMETMDRRRDYESAAERFRREHNSEWKDFIAKSPNRHR